jgi:hypothetical protein
MREYITIVENMNQWPQTLTGEELVRYMALTDNYLGSLADPSYADIYWDEQVESGDVAANLKRYAGCTATLRRIPIEGLIRNNGYVDDETLEDYERARSFSAAPPIVVRGKHILEGNHRVEVARRWGEEDIMAYVVTGPDEEPL